MRETGFLILMIWLAGLVSCSKSTEIAGEFTPGSNEVMIRLVVSRPHSAKSAAISDPETEIGEVQILVFEEGAYKYRVPGISITNTGTTTSFNARLTSSDKMLDLYLVANATAAILANEPTLNDTKEKVRAKLQAAFSASATFPFLPMFGSHNLPTGLNSEQVKTISGIQMLRAIARVDVLLGSVPNFELKSIQAYRANGQIQLIPVQNTPTVTVPSISPNSRMDVNTNAIAVSGNQVVAGFYLPESASPAEAEQVKGATCIVIGGRYGSDTGTTYYRIDFDPNNTNGTFGQILRNHQYVFTIQSVAGPGWSTPDDAANNRSAQINLEIKDWDVSTTDMYFDLEHHFGVSTREITLKSKQNASGFIQVDTDIPDYTLQWSDALGNITGNAGETLTDTYFKIEKNNDGSRLLLTALQENTTTERTVYFVINANRWRIRITLHQSNTSGFKPTITLLSFNNFLGHFGQNLLLPKVTSEGRGMGASGILSNLSNFGPTGTVVCGGFNLLVSNASANSLSETALAVADIVYFNYVSNSYLSTQDVAAIRQWLEATPKRVLIVSYDGSGVNVPILTEFLNSINSVKWFGSNTGPYPLVTKTAATNYFTEDGPFTVSPYTPIADNFSFQNYDAYHGEITAASEPEITPILNGPGGGIVLGIDFTHRIIYMGDVDLNTASNGTGSSNTNHINNNKGNITNDAAELIANVFAWAVGIIIQE